MIGASSPLRALHSVQAFSMKHPPSSNISSMRKKTLLHTLITSHVHRLVRALAKAKSVFVANLKTKGQPIHFIYPTEKRTNKNNKKKKKIFFGSFRLPSSHVIPMHAAPILDLTYYDASWNSIITEEQKHEDESEAQLSGYLKWLEEKKVHANSPTDHDEQQDLNEIDRLAEIFIANCREKFILEKQESYMRFQEMLARSI